MTEFESFGGAEPDRTYRDREEEVRAKAGVIAKCSTQGVELRRHISATVKLVDAFRADLAAARKEKEAKKKAAKEKAEREKAGR